MKHNLILMLPTMLILTACGSFPHSPSIYTTTTAATHFDSELYDDFNKAVIIISANNALGANYKIYNYATIYSMDNPNIKYDLKMENNQPQIVMMSPGKYKLSNISFFGSTNAGNMHFQTSLDLDDEFFAEFVLQPNDIVYVGNLNTTTRYGKREGGGLFMGNTKTQVSANVEAVDLSNKMPIDFKREIESKFGTMPKTKLLKIERKNKVN